MNHISPHHHHRSFWIFGSFSIYPYNNIYFLYATDRFRAIFVLMQLETANTIKRINTFMESLTFNKAWDCTAISWTDMINSAFETFVAFGRFANNITVSNHVIFNIDYQNTMRVYCEHTDDILLVPGFDTPWETVLPALELAFDVSPNDVDLVESNDSEELHNISNRTGDFFLFFFWGGGGTGTENKGIHKKTWQCSMRSESFKNESQSWPLYVSQGFCHLNTEIKGI